MSEEIKEIPENVRTMADNLKENATVEDNVITFRDDAFKANLPEDFKFKQAKQYERHKVDFSAAVHLATGEIGNDLIKKNDYNEVSTSPVDVIYGQLEVTQRRHRSGVSKINDTETPWEHYGTLSAIYRSRINRKVGSVRIVRDHIMREAKELFGK